MADNVDPSKIAYLEIKDIIRTMSADTALLIYIYLVFLGKSRPGKIWADLQISKATGFRHLSEMERTDIVKKFIDPEVEDKRYNTFYLINKPIYEMMGSSTYYKAQPYFEKHDEEFHNEWVTYTRQFLANFNKMTNQLFHLMADLSDEPKNILDKIEFGKQFNVAFLLDGEINKEMATNIRNFFHDLYKENAKKQLLLQDFEKGIKNPIFLGVEFLDFGNISKDKKE